MTKLTREEFEAKLKGLKTTGMSRPSGATTRAGETDMSELKRKLGLDAAQDRIAELEREVAQHRRHLEFRNKEAREAASAASIWEGKFHAVKRENNALRRKVWRLQQEKDA